MPANTSSFSKLLAPGLRKVFNEDYKTWPEEYSKIFTLETSKRAYEEELVLMGLGRLERKSEGVSIKFDQAKQGGVKRYTHVTFALGFDVTKEMWEDDLYSEMVKMSKMLSQSVQQTVELEAGLFLDDVFTGATYTGADAQPLCSTAHPLLVGGTLSNTPAQGTDLTPGALRTGYESTSALLNERGLPIFRVPKMLVVPPPLAWVAEEIIKAQKVPYSMNNEPNATQGIMGLNYMVSHYQSDTNAWLLLPDKAQSDLKFFWRIKPQFTNDDDPKTGDAMFMVRVRFSLGFTDWRGAYGSAGTT
jgi:phage major head subunit gpT-like protein